MSEQGPTGFTVWTVLRRDPLTAQGQIGQAAAGAEALADAVAAVEAGDVVVRGVYDVSAMRGDADLMLWLHGPTAEGLQAAVRRLRRSRELAPLALTWSAMGVHRDAEFNKAHVPGFLRGVEPRGWLCVYPFVRSYDWYVLPDDDRKAMLAEHGRKGAAFRSVIANTVSAFALNDYEWLLPLESDELTDLVDMMRELRATRARLHVREEVPFFTGRRIGLDEVAEVLA
ncbi:hydrogen peroxide-dependent heme synthase [Micropruina sp.]|uniref:hydrogen peroxide-dependent heme synthase n=1 Tax=Micropruina sp. TaxID=2737536 RepID=UPI002617D743|nr:hydrogen peroxide-dependent heme synthase [Micropruina sp.]